MSLTFENNTIPKIDEQATFGELSYRSYTPIFESGEDGARTEMMRELRLLFYSSTKKDFVEITFPVDLEEKVKTLRRKEVIELIGDVQARGWYASKEQGNGFVTAESGLKFFASDFRSKKNSNQNKPQQKESNM